jgi:hypothetical protein
MAVQDNGTRIQYTATASQTVFPYPFEILDEDDITVVQNSTTLSKTTHYTVSGVGSDTGGNITFVTGATSGDVITIYRSMALSRVTNYQANAAFLESEVDADFDRLWMGVQQNESDVTRAIRASQTDSILNSTNTELAAPAVRAGKSYGFDSTGDIEYKSVSVVDGDAKFTTKSVMENDTTAVVGTTVYILSDRANGIFDTVTVGTTPNVDLPNGFNIIVSTVDATKCFVLRIESEVQVRSFGSAGDGVADDNGAIQAAFDSKARVILGHLDDSYLSESQLEMAENQTLDLCGAELKFNESGVVRYLITNNGCTVKNGTVRSVTADVAVRGAEYQQPICIGFSNSLTDFVKDVIVQNVTLSSTSPEGNALFVFGACDNILCENITIEAGAALGEPIGGHWSVEPGGDETQGTGHPNNVTFRNVTIGAQTYGGAGAVFLSAVRNFTFENIEMEAFTGDGVIQVFAGDHGFKYANDNFSEDFGTVLKLENIQGIGKKGVVIQMRDTLEDLIIWPSTITLDNVNMQSNGTTVTDSRGLELGSVKNVTVRNSVFDLFYNGEFLNSEAVDITIEDSKFTNCYKSGVDADNSTDCANLTYSRVRFDSSNTAGGTGYDMNFGSFISNIVIDNCRFNSSGVTFNVNCLSAAPPRNMKVINNHVEASGGTNFVFGSSTSFGICELFNGNTQAETVTSNIRGGQQYIPYIISGYVNDQLPVKYYTGAGTPSYGTYNIGDEIKESAPAAAGKMGSVCTASGTQGTYSEGRTATTDGTTSITLNSASDVIRKGDYLTINSTAIRVESINGTAIVSDVTVAAGSGLAITYTNATFKLWGAINA